MSFFKMLEKKIERRREKEMREKIERKERREREEKQAQVSLKKMMRYTAKKFLWLVNYSISFSKKDSKKEILIKVLGCFVILNCICLSFFIVSSLLELMLTKPLLLFGSLAFTILFLFKSEIRGMIQEELNNK
ncbi:MAG: hypothetical protein OXN83_03635 [Oligoflexia bacterium]|nr:hypothetical protein [Oligoflexia bacterium]